MRYSKPIEWVAWMLVGIGLLTAQSLSLEPSDQRGMQLAALAGAIYISVYFHFLLPRSEQWKWVRYVPSFAVVLILASVYYFTGSRSEVEALYTLVVVVVGIRRERTIAFITAVLSALAILVVPLLKPVPSASLWTSKLIIILVYGLAAYLSASLAEQFQRQYQRMTVLNQVAHALGSTIEMDQLLELIYQQLSRVISTDTYYVGLYHEGDASIDRLITIDAGQRYPRESSPFGIGLASYAIQRKKPQLFNSLAVERKSLGIGTALVGTGRPSESWLGVPVQMEDGYTCLIVVASYKPNAFTQEDVELLQNIGAQAALALHNAQQHAFVKDQARRDSLTGVFNHGYFFKQLSWEVKRAQESSQPVSLIMLDIDHFKQYNDTYGHVIGDQVLRLIVQVIQTHVKQDDTVGRWGGEEFGIILPVTNVDQALTVAQRIRETLTQVPLVDATGRMFPKPTVSQGIATFPTLVADANQLVDVADMTLYRAKAQGRDQVLVAESRLE